LEILEIDDCNDKVFQFFEGCQVKELTIAEKFFLKYDEGLKRFLMTQTELERLNIRMLCDYPLRILFSKFTSMLDCSQFKLKKLTIHTERMLYPIEQYHDFQKFLQSQANSVEVIKISGLYRDIIFEQIFTKFSRIHTLEIVGFQHGFLPDHASFYEQLDEIKSVKTLIVESLQRPCNRRGLKPLMRKLPNVETFIYKDA
jgi:hypothetical protein